MYKSIIRRALLEPHTINSTEVRMSVLFLFLVVCFSYPVQCPITIASPQPFEDYVVGGSAISLTISDPCSLAADDTPNCIFDGFVVAAERSDANSATCVIPSVRDPGSVPFEFSYVSRTLGSVTFTSTLEACKFL